MPEGNGPEKREMLTLGERMEHGLKPASSVVGFARHHKVGSGNPDQHEGLSLRGLDLGTREP